MPTQIKQIRDDDRGTTILRVEGEILRRDAILIETLVTQIREVIGDRVTLDLADLDALDSEAASILRRLTSFDWFEIGGIEIFLQSVVDNTERRGP